MDFKKMANLAIVPTAILFLVRLAQTGMQLISINENITWCFAGLIFLLSFLVVCGWAGYNAVKAGGVSIMEAAGTGTIASLGSNIVGVIIDLILMVAGILLIAMPNGTITTLAEAGTESEIGGAFIILIAVGILIAICINVVLCTICAAIGGYIASRK